MARRRSPARPVLAADVDNPLPEHLRPGPCIEDWAGPPTPGTGEHATAVAYLARRAWSEAVHEWAETSGWARPDRPADNACNLARTRRPWSRVFLLARGEAALVDYFEGRRQDWPGRPGDGWEPLRGPAGGSVGSWRPTDD